MERRKGFYLCLVVLVVIVVGGCGETAETPQPTERPTAPPSPTLDLTPDAEDIVFVFPAEVGRGEIFTLAVRNEGQVPYAYSVGSHRENCLFVMKVSGFVMTAVPECDALELVVLGPGEERFVGSWDLMACVDVDCLARVWAEGGRYAVEMVFYPYREGEELVGEEGIEKGVEFVVVEGEE